mgnify:CR=1 FL=1
MKGSRPIQAALSRDTDMSKTEATQKVIESMVDGLNDHRIADIGEFFSQTFSWMGNQGCGTKQGLKEFQKNWQQPFLEDSKIRNEEPKVVVETVPEKQLETLEVSEESPQVVTETLEDLFATAISEPVFVKKESPALEEEAGVEQNPKNLNDVLVKGLKIGLNDRLAFIKNLFDEQPEEYQRVISQILTYENLDEAQEFIETFVKPEYNSWEGKESFEDRFYKIIEQNFN